MRSWIKRVGSSQGDLHTMGHSLIQPVYNIEMWWRFFIESQSFGNGVSCLCWGLTFLWIWEDFFWGFWFVGFGFGFEAEIGFWFCVDVDFWYGSWRQVLWFGFKYSNELICCVLLSLNENLFWLLVPFKVFIFIFIFIFTGNVF